MIETLLIFAFFYIVEKLKIADYNRNARDQYYKNLMNKYNNKDK